MIYYDDLEQQVTRMKLMHNTDKRTDIIVQKQRMSAKKKETEQLTTRTVAMSANTRTNHDYKIAE